MVYVVSLVSAVFLGLGWVLQQRIASRSDEPQPLSWGLILTLIRQPLWWAGIGALILGQVLGGWALQLGSVSLVEALLSTYLIFAFTLAALFVRWKPRWQEITGAALLSAALGVFVGFGHPHSNPYVVALAPILLAAGGVALVAVVLTVAARRRGAVGEAVFIAVAAGALYGLQDASTRAALVVVDRDGVGGLVASPWPYLVVCAAASGLILMQSAFRSARLDYSLPPAAATEPLTGIALGVWVLGDQLTVTPAALAVEGVCAAALIGGVWLIGRSPALGVDVHRPAVSAEAGER